MGYNRRFKSRKTDIGSKRLTRDTIHNQGSYLAVGFKQIKERIASIILPRPKKSLDEVNKEDLKVVGLSEDLAQDRRLWRNRIRILNGREASL